MFSDNAEEGMKAEEALELIEELELDDVPLSRSERNFVDSISTEWAGQGKNLTAAQAEKLKKIYVDATGDEW